MVDKDEALAAENQEIQLRISNSLEQVARELETIRKLMELKQSSHSEANDEIESAPR